MASIGSSAARRLAESVRLGTLARADYDGVMNSRARWRDAAVVAALLMLAVPAAARRRAVIVGIDGYLPPGQPTTEIAAATRARGMLSDLAAAVSDAEEMAALLRSPLFAFDEVTLLRNHKATRAAILSTVEARLIRPARRGDVSLLYFAGHGSQMRDSSDPRGFDETIVPGDAWKGVYDIRDKEIAALLNRMLSRGAQAIAIFDSCHSGDLSRGLTGVAPVTRRIGFDPRDAARLPRPPSGPAPESGGALILSAALDKQAALEIEDEHGNPRGAFTMALVRMLRSDPDAAIGDVMRSVRTAVQAHAAQEPVIRATADRERRTLIGDPPRAPSELRVAIRPHRRTAGLFHVDGGSALGFRPGVRLRQLTATGGGAELEITQVHSPASSTARLVSGRARGVRSGDLFRISAWTPDPAGLRVWWPETPPGRAELARRLEEIDAIVEKHKLTLVHDPTEMPPDFVLRLVNGRWALTDTGRTKKGTHVFVELPPPRELTERLAASAASEFARLQRAQHPAKAHYVLTGRASGGTLEYAWVRRHTTAAADGTQGLPMRSAWIQFAPNDLAGTVAALQETAVSAAHLYAWRTLAAPPAAAAAFPYRLAFRDKNQRITDGPFVAGHTYQPVLIATVAEPRITPRWVYVFTIDTNGGGRLIVPAPGTRGTNYVPRHDPSDPLRRPERVIPLEAVFEIGEPLGNDTYVLFTTETPIVHEEHVFEWSTMKMPPPRARSSGGAMKVPMAPPMTWSLERRTIDSVSRPR
jgi:hypothetical protein